MTAIATIGVYEFDAGSFLAALSGAEVAIVVDIRQRRGVRGLGSVWLDPSAPGAVLPGQKVMSLVRGMLAGADSIDDMNVCGLGAPVSC